MKDQEPKIICIIGAPRTGSTLLYQLIVNMFDVFYFSNYVNNFQYKHPAESSIITYYRVENAKPVPYKSKQGKTKGMYSPSEASNLFKYWFGSGHPSQLLSSTPLSVQKKKSILYTMNKVYKDIGKPIVIKNAWNCFRIKSLYEMFSAIKFIWIRRDIAHSASSDLATRYKRGNKEVWSSATTFNWETIQKLPYWKRPVKQQYWYSKAIADSLSSLPKDTSITLWYEDLCRNTRYYISKLGEFCNIEDRYTDNIIPRLKPSVWVDIPSDDKFKIVNYIEENLIVFKDYLYTWET